MKYMKLCLTTPVLSTAVQWDGSSTTATMLPILHIAATGHGMLTLIQKCLASVSFTNHTISFFPTAVFCNESKIPQFINGTEPGTIDQEERKAIDPERWNAFGKHLTYTCPVGFVIEKPNSDSEQQDPIPTTQEQFDVECWNDATWMPVPQHGGNVMPTCIRKKS